MILLTGATGSIGSRLLPRLLEAGHEVRCLVRDPLGLGDHRVDVGITLGDLRELPDPYLLRQAMRGVDTVIHLAASIRDQPPHPVEELNGLATVRLVTAAELAGVDRFLYFSALGSGPTQRTRFFRAKWVGEEAVRSSPLATTIFRPSLVFDHSDPWVRLARRFSFLPMIPVVGRGSSRYQPVWADDVARAVMARLDGAAATGAAPDGGTDVFELAGPEMLTYREMTRLVGELAGRPRPALPLPLPVVWLGLSVLHRLFGENVFTTWQEAELMRVSMTTPRGSTDLEALGITPQPMAAVLAPN